MVRWAQSDLELYERRVIDVVLDDLACTLQEKGFVGRELVKDHLLNRGLPTPAQGKRIPAFPNPRRLWKESSALS